MIDKLTNATPPAAQAWPPEQGQWTYEDWLRLPDDGFRYEVIDGVMYMSPPPSFRHQSTVTELARQMGNYVVEHKLGQVVVAPCGVRLPDQPVPVQPDIFFVKAERLHIVGEDYIEGTPDLVVEVLSPSNWLYDRREKFQAYQAARVAEYWIVDYRAKTIEVFVLEAGTYTLIGQFEVGQTVASRILAGFEIKVDEVVG